MGPATHGAFAVYGVFTIHIFQIGLIGEQALPDLLQPDNICFHDKTPFFIMGAIREIHREADRTQLELNRLPVKWMTTSHPPAENFLAMRHSSNLRARSYGKMKNFIF
jgi:hypothetical protein